MDHRIERVDERSLISFERQNSPIACRIIQSYPEPEPPTIATLCPDGTVNDSLSNIFCPST